MPLQSYQTDLKPSIQCLVDEYNIISIDDDRMLLKQMENRPPDLTPITI